MNETAVKKAAPKKKAPVKKDSVATIKSFAIDRQQDGWYLITSFISGDKVVKTNKVGPTMRAIIVEEFKIESQRMIEGIE